MEAVILLADSAQGDQSGKVHALGLGWSWTITPTPPAAVIVLMKVPWTETNKKHPMRLQLLDQDGQQVTIQGPDGNSQPVEIAGEFEVGRPPGVPPGSAIDNSLAVNVGAGMPLTVGQTYVWRLEIDGEHQESWQRSFFVRAQ